MGQDCINLFRENESTLSADRESHKEFPDDWPYPIFPEKDGLYLWGVTTNGDYLYWQTIGEPKQWPTIIIGEGSSPIEVFPTTTTGLLSDWLSGNTESEILIGKDQYFDPIFEKPESLESVEVFINYIELSFEERLKKVMRLFGSSKIKGKHIFEGYSQCHFIAESLNIHISYQDNKDYGSRITISYSPIIEASIKGLITQIRSVMGWSIRGIQRVNGNEIWPALKDDSSGNIK